MSKVAIPPSLRSKLSSPSPFLFSSLQYVDILHQDLTGRIVPMKVSTRTFELFEIKSLILELPLVDKASSSMQKVEHPIMRGATQNYFVIPDFDTLLKMHKPNHIYRVLSRKARSIQSYVTMKEICAAPGSPFSMRDRVDPHNYKATMKNEWDAVIKEWNDSLEARSHNFTISGGQPIGFDGMLISENDVAVLLVNQQLNEKAVSTITGSIAFLKQTVTGSNKRVTQDYEQLWSSFLKRRKIHYFLSGDRPPTRDALGFARQKGVHMYSRYGPYVRYCL